MQRVTPLYNWHVAAGAKMVPFAGYLMPVQYTGVIEEHMAVRQKAGLFDVSHMGEVTFSGLLAEKNLNRLLTNNFSGMKDGQVRYSPICNEEGGVIDDVIVYRISADLFFVVVNAANRQKDVDWLKSRVSGAPFRDVSDSWAQVALQGPLAEQILLKLTKPENIPAKYYTFTPGLVLVGGVKCMVSQTGYTGEKGYELYCEPDAVEILWNKIMEAGQPEGLIPCGLGARDTLRLEAGMPLYGHEMDDSISPLETGLGFAVKMDKPDFVGKAALADRGAPQIARVGLKMTGRGIARENCPVFYRNEMIGRTTSGTFLPFLNGAYAMALIDKSHREVGTALDVEVRGSQVAAEVVPLPFYKRPR